MLIDSEAKLGEILKAIDPKKLAAQRREAAKRGDHKCHNEICGLPEGVTPKESSRAQKLAAIPLADRRKHVKEIREKGKPLTSAALPREPEQLGQPPVEPPQ